MYKCFNLIKYVKDNDIIITKELSFNQILVQKSNDYIAVVF